MDAFGRLARNGHWTWYARQHGRQRPLPGFMGFLLASLPHAEPTPPGSLPTSRLFRGTGQAVMNVTLLAARDNVEIVFKSSPFGTQSHGYESQNAFLVYAYGRRLFIRSGRRDIYGSPHHKNWMWHTRSVNSITVNGQGQTRHSAGATGEISAFFASRELDYARGDAAEAYPGTMTRFTRHVLFLKPDCIVVYDEVEAPEPARFGLHLHMPVAPSVAGTTLSVRNGDASARAWFLTPRNLEVTVTDRFDPPPRPHVKLREWHLTARNELPVKRTAFVTVLRPFRTHGAAPVQPVFHRVKGGFALDGFTGGRRFLVLLRLEGNQAVQHGGWKTEAEVGAVVFAGDGKPLRRFASRGGEMRE